MTQDEIRAYFHSELDRALALYPAHFWKHPFRALYFSRARRSYGQARNDGSITLSRAFIGVGAEDDLRDTIRHELAHLIAGIGAKHGPRWRAVAIGLGCSARASGNPQHPELEARMSDAPYELFAILSSGEERLIRRAHRRSRAYLDYRLGAGPRSYHVDGQAVLHFEYRRPLRAAGG